MDEQEPKTTSPVIKKPKYERQKYTFHEALQLAYEGKIITKLEWGSDDIFFEFVEDELTLINNKKISRWIISKNDFIGDDYVVLKD